MHHVASYLSCIFSSISAARNAPAFPGNAQKREEDLCCGDEICGAVFQTSRARLKASSGATAMRSLTRPHGYKRLLTS